MFSPCVGDTCVSVCGERQRSESDSRIKRPSRGPALRYDTECVSLADRWLILYNVLDSKRRGRRDRSRRALPGRRKRLVQQTVLPGRLPRRPSLLEGVAQASLLPRAGSPSVRELAGLRAPTTPSRNNDRLRTAPGGKAAQLLQPDPEQPEDWQERESLSAIEHAGPDASLPLPQKMEHVLRHRRVDEMTSCQR